MGVASPEQTRAFEQGEFSSIKVSPSRLNSYVSCGVAFKMHYIDRIPATKSGSAALFGNVIHKGLESWALDRSQDLVPLIRAAWRTETEGTPVKDFITEYESICVEVLKAEKRAADAFLAKNGRETFAARMTKVFKESPEAKKEAKLLARWIPRLDKESPWRFTERDPLPKLYGESLVLAKRHEKRYRNFPAALHTELHFTEEWNGFLLDGYIDAIEPLFGEPGELIGLDIVDYKTYAKPSPLAKDWRQGVFYDVAFRALMARDVMPLPGVVDGELTVPLRITFDYPRLGTRRHFDFTDADRDQLLDEIQMYHRGVSAGVFLPAEKGRNPDFCDYPENCCLLNRGGGCAAPTETEIPLVA